MGVLEGVGHVVLVGALLDVQHPDVHGDGYRASGNEKKRIKKWLGEVGSLFHRK